MTKFSLHVKRQGKLSIQLERQNKPFRIINATAISPSDRADFIQDEVEVLGQNLTLLEGLIDSGQQRYEQLTISSNQQTVFTLTSTPTAPHLAQLFLDGEKAVFGIDFVIDGLLLTWLSPVPLATDDQLEIYY